MSEIGSPDARQLERLRALREDAARSALQRSRRHLAERQALVDQRLQEVGRVRGDRRALIVWMAGPGASQMPRLAAAAAARLAAVDEALERAEVALGDERLALANAVRAVAAARAAWLQARQRQLAVAQLVGRAQRRLSIELERRGERELDDTRAVRH